MDMHSSPIDPDLREVFEQLQLEPGPFGNERTPQDLSARTTPAWETLATQIVGPAASPSPRNARTGMPMIVGGLWAGITVAVLCVVGVMATWVYRSGSETPTMRYQTAAGQVSRVTLPDGTVMTLAPATSVAVSHTRGGDAVDVDGEAYFHVASSSKSPFVVRTSNTIVQVLGTAFSVRRYANEARTRIVVEDGKVAVRAKQRGVLNQVPTAITARMMAQVSDSGVAVTPVSDTRTLTGWHDGVLVFDGAPLRDVVPEIARSYNAVVRIEGKDLANERLVLEVAVRQVSLNQVLTLVGIATNAHVRRDGDAFVLVPGRDAATSREKQLQKLLPQPEKIYGR